jgi:hypothetical protein
MKDDIEALVAGVIAIVASVLLSAVACFALGLFAKLVWIPLSMGWNLL